MLYYWGDASLVWGADCLAGGMPAPLDAGGCAVSTALAWQLFGSEEAVGLTLFQEKVEYTVRGVFESEEPVALLPKADAAFTAAELPTEADAGGDPAARVDACLAKSGLPEPDWRLYTPCPPRWRGGWRGCRWPSGRQCWRRHCCAGRRAFPSLQGMRCSSPCWGRRRWRSPPFFGLALLAHPQPLERFLLVEPGRRPAFGDGQSLPHRPVRGAGPGRKDGGPGPGWACPSAMRPVRSAALPLCGGGNAAAPNGCPRAEGLL